MKLNVHWNEALSQRVFFYYLSSVRQKVLPQDRQVVGVHSAS